MDEFDDGISREKKESISNTTEKTLNIFIGKPYWFKIKNLHW